MRLVAVPVAIHARPTLSTKGYLRPGPAPIYGNGHGWIEHSELLIRGFGVQVPGGAPVLTCAFFLRVAVRGIRFSGLVARWLLICPALVHRAGLVERIAARPMPPGGRSGDLPGGPLSVPGGMLERWTWTWMRWPRRRTRLRVRRWAGRWPCGWASRWRSAMRCGSWYRSWWPLANGSMS